MARTNPKLWEQAKSEAKAKMGGKHSARAMQLAGKIYKDKGGSYSGEKTKAQKSLSKWTAESWGTKSGKPSTQGPKATGERYLPKKAREALSPKEYAATTKAKREGTKKGKQFVAQPKKIAEKTAKYRK
jgi:phospholipase/lecithinase/hemolysin